MALMKFRAQEMVRALASRTSRTMHLEPELECFFFVVLIWGNDIASFLGVYHYVTQHFGQTFSMKDIIDPN